MNNKLINFIVKKYLIFDKKNPFISISAILAFVGVSVGIMVLIIAMSIMNGTAKEFESKLFTMNYPISIYPREYGAINQKLLDELENKFPNLIFSPYLKSQVMIQGKSKINGGLLFGVNHIKESKINNIYKKSVLDIDDFSKYHIITGSGIQDNLDLQKNDKVTIYFTSLNPNGFAMIPKMKRFKYKTYFRSGLNAFDNAYMYTSIESLQTILRIPKDIFHGIHVYSSNAMKDIKLIRKEFPQLSIGIIGWWQQNGNFFSAMQLEKKSLFIVLMLIILIASLNIISSLLMTVMSRRKEIALLLSMGASQKEVKSIFLRLGSIIGIGGILFGVFLGFSGLYMLDNFDIISLPRDVYGTTKLPLELTVSDFLSIVIGATLMVFVSSYYPAHKATKIDVLDVLRNE